MLQHADISEMEYYMNAMSVNQTMSMYEVDELMCVI